MVKVEDKEDLPLWKEAGVSLLQVKLDRGKRKFLYNYGHLLSPETAVKAILGTAQIPVWELQVKRSPEERKLFSLERAFPKFAPVSTAILLANACAIEDFVIYLDLLVKCIKNQPSSREEHVRIMFSLKERIEDAALILPQGRGNLYVSIFEQKLFEFVHSVDLILEPPYSRAAAPEVAEYRAMRNWAFELKSNVPVLQYAYDVELKIENHTLPGSLYAQSLLAGSGNVFIPKVHEEEVNEWLTSNHPESVDLPMIYKKKLINLHKDEIIQDYIRDNPTLQKMKEA